MTRLWLVAAAGVLVPVVGRTRIDAGEDAVEQLRKQVAAVREQVDRTRNEIRQSLELARVETPAGLTEAVAGLQQAIQQLEGKLDGSPDAAAQASIREDLARTRRALNGLIWTRMAAHILRHLPERSIAIQDREMVKRYEAMLRQRLATGVAQTVAALAGKPVLQEYRDFGTEFTKARQQDIQIIRKALTIAR